MICAEKYLKFRFGDSKKHKSHHREGERAREKKREREIESKIK